MSANKTTENDGSVSAFLNSIADEVQRADSFLLAAIFSEQSGYEPKMWGHAIVGFGSYHYRYESGREGDAPRLGFSPRAKELSLYLSANFAGREELLQQFGKHKTGKGCIYVKKLVDINEDVLRKMIDASLAFMNANYPEGR